ncbi:MAG: DNA polymerase III subunit beta [Kiritimatiellae bacterium]|nr:DNA polymerase III subunit beta [Kiritimatiellia bacterium]
MNLTVNRSELTKALSIVARVANPKGYLPILGNIFLSADNDGKLLIAASDLETTATYQVSAEVAETGKITIPENVITDLLKAMSGDKVHLHALNNRVLVVEDSESKAEIRGIPADEFPPLPEAIETMASFEAAELKRALLQTTFAAEKDGLRPTLEGVLVESVNDHATFVATDGFRLSVVQSTAKLSEGKNFILPSAGLRELTKLLLDSDVSMCATSNNQIMFKNHTLTFSMSCVDGKFPDYKAILDNLNSSTVVVVETDPLLEACLRADIITREENVSRHVVFDIAVDKVNVSGRSKQSGSAETDVPAQVNGQPIKIAFNPKFIIEALKAVDGPIVTIEMSSPNAPVLIRSGAFRHALMPLTPISKGGEEDDNRD